MVEIVKMYGSEKIMINSAADWGISDALAVPKTAALMLERGIAESDIQNICYNNALRAFGQSGQMHETDWLKVEPIDRTQKFAGSTILRGGQSPLHERKQSKIIR